MSPAELARTNIACAPGPGVAAAPDGPPVDGPPLAGGTFVEEHAAARAHRTAARHAVRIDPSSIVPHACGRARVAPRGVHRRARASRGAGRRGPRGVTAVRRGR